MPSRIVQVQGLLAERKPFPDLHPAQAESLSHILVHELGVFIL